ncbi:MAG: cupredoxin domain-containing protein [Nitrosopumilus sp.]|uniref:cupredoxin domain-containing protein n=1 Tax=Nitrosopumilus sp. TaxID=2024843 RepID=UPI00242B09BE|nr:cupredoxin domain-containing protein [Nitrosopumilus sp.]MCV0367648.1 cupredoxin domain-containing protein [Nitrosopumilus sp.]
MNKTKKKLSKLSRTNIISVSVVAGVVILIGGIALNSLSPVNYDGFVFAPSTNVFLKAVKSPQDIYHYQLTKGGKALQSSSGTSPSIIMSKGNLVQIHLINEEKNQLDNPSKHNLNIDEFNVHIKDLSYFQSESVTFLADKTGTFDYYCSIHPGMKGTITITE